MSFKKGDRVYWDSQANGSQTQKVGEVVAVVQPNRIPSFFDLKRKHKAMLSHGYGDPRDHKSYVILVRRGNAKPALYWPRVAALQPA